MIDLTTGPGLVAAIASQLNREDLNDQIPGWIAMGEKQIERVLRVPRMIQRADAATADAFVSLPSEFLEMKSLQLVGPSGKKRVLNMTSNDELVGVENCANPLIATNEPQSPTHFTVIDGEIRLAPAPTSEITIELVYYAKIPKLDTQTVGATTWLLQDAPDLMLFSALVFSSFFLMEEDRAQNYSTLASAAVQAMNLQAENAQHAGSRLVRKLRTF